MIKIFFWWKDSIKHPSGKRDSIKHPSGARDSIKHLGSYSQLAICTV
jgi:hypothetical protein